MRALHQLVLLSLPLLGTVYCEEPASPTKQSSLNPYYASAQDAFMDLLNALPEESLHAALHSIAKFKEGIFESDRHGVERVHEDNPPLATKLIVAAVQDLKKRQNPVNGTTPPPQTTQKPPVVVPVPVTTTDGNGKGTVVTSEILSDPTTSIEVPVTRTNEQGETFTSVETKPAVVFTTTDSAGRTIETASAVDFAPTPGQVLTKTNKEGSTFLTTYTPDGGRVSSVLLITTTGPDGKQSVITSYTFVEATPTGTENNPTQANGRPGFQTNAASMNRGLEMAMVGGAIGAFAFFV